MFYKIVGLKVHYYLDDVVVKKNNDFNIDLRMLIGHIICLADNDNNKYELYLYETHGEITPDFKSTMVFAHYHLYETEDFGSFTHIPKHGLSNIIDYIDYDYFTKQPNNIFYDDYECAFFSYSYSGNDVTDSNGYVQVNLQMFASTNYGFIKNPIWIFNGDVQLYDIYKKKSVLNVYTVPYTTNNDIDNRLNDTNDACIIDCDIVHSAGSALNDYKQNLNGLLIQAKFCGNYVQNNTTWVFTGKSNTGKYYLANRLNHVLTVFDIDTCVVLPDVIDADIVVVSSKCNHNYNEVLSKIKNNIVQVFFQRICTNETI